ncbi:MAG: hypothetical protein IT232_08550 [Flavobacteriales bacterium]|nr:hypothetical protein [Flavobacteriales bacterium]
MIIGLVSLYFFSKSRKNNLQIENESFDYEKYADLVKLAESNNNYKAQNSIGALGAYQFMETTLNSLKELFDLPEWKPKENFLNNPDLQDLYHEKLVESNIQALKNSGADDWLGIVVSGSKNPKYKDYVAQTNYSGLLAGSHLAGVGSVKRFFTQGINKDDGYTSVSDYIAFFSNKLSEAA